MPAFRVEMNTRTPDDVVDHGHGRRRRKKPSRLITVREPADRRPSLAVPDGVQTDLLQAAAVVPAMRQAHRRAAHVRLLRLELDGLT